MNTQIYQVWRLDWVVGSLDVVFEGTYKKCRKKAQKLRDLNVTASVLPKPQPEPWTLLAMERIYPTATKQALKRLLQNAIRMIDTNEINAADDLGILCSHIQTIAWVSDTAENEDAFTYGLHGDWKDHTVCAALQGGDNAIERNTWASWIEISGNEHIGSMPNDSEEPEPEPSGAQVAV